ncbi:hypothetical protein [Synechococcus sp. MIT S1220]|uniref:hypothetical protein n=1 Tax=Synechococcus sp. MIT S1220 TaxID=3082549 RepID=UPI0039B0104D
MKLLPIIGALLLSAAPVQAFETFEELDKTCQATEELTNLCQQVSIYGAAVMAATLLCDLEVKGILTKENLVLTWDKWNKVNGSPMRNAGTIRTLEEFPRCSLKPIP